MAGLISASVAVLPQESRAVSFTPVPANFTGSDAALVSNNASSSGVLNQNNGATVGTTYSAANQVPIGGFNGFFGATYLSLGALSGQTIGASGKNQNSSANSTLFTLTAADFTTGIDLRFNYAIAGFAANDNIPRFKVTLQTLTGFGGANGSINFTVPGITSVSPSNGGSAGVFRRATVTGVVASLTAADFVDFSASNDYFLQFALDEPTASAGTNAAAGFNQFSVTSSVPFDFDTSAGIAILGAGFGLNKLRKKLKAKKDVDV